MYPFLLPFKEKEIIVVNMKKFFFVLGIYIWALSSWATDYRAIDRHAKEAPPLRTTNGLSKLVNYLVKPYKNDQNKARVLLAWIVYNIDYDKARLKDITLGREKKDIEMVLDVEKNPRTGELELKKGNIVVLNEEDTIQRTLKTRKGICKDIAKLYQHMCDIAGLQSEIITGYACDQSQDLQSAEAHMWNAVKISGVWYFVDPTFALAGREIRVRNQREAKKVKKQLKQGKNVDGINGISKRVDEQWFLVGQEDIIKTHFPFERRWQLQQKRTTFEDFLKKQCHTTLEEFMKQH